VKAAPATLQNAIFIINTYAHAHYYKEDELEIVATAGKADTAHFKILP
jgi:hypothetical protein